MQKLEPQPEHQWLQKLVGNWTFEGEASMGPDQPPIKSTGTESVTSMDGLWFLCAGEGQMPEGGAAPMLMTLGYNTSTKRYLGTWIGCMTTHMFVYDGFVEGNTLHLEAEGPSMADDGSMAKYRDSIEIVDDDNRILRSSYLKDGQWIQFMTVPYRRV